MKSIARKCALKYPARYASVLISEYTGSKPFLAADRTLNVPMGAVGLKFLVRLGTKSTEPRQNALFATATSRICKVADGELVTSIPLDAAVDGMAFSPDGRVLVTGKEGGVVQAWSFPDMELVRSIKLAGTINSVTFTRDGRYLALAGHPNKVWVLEAEDFGIVHTLEGFPDVAAISVRIADDKGLIAAGQIGGHVSVWDLESGELVSRFNHTGYKVEAVCWTNDGNYLLAAGLNEYIRVVRTVDLGMENVPVAHLSPPAGRTEYLDFAPNGSSLVSAHEDGTVRLWLWKSGDLDINIKHHRALKERQRQAAEERLADRAAKGIKSR